MHGPLGASNFTKLVNNLVSQIHSTTPVKDSLFEQAEIYFTTAQNDKQKRQALAASLKDITEKHSQASKIAKIKLKKELDLEEQIYKNEINRQKQLRIARLNQFKKIGTLIIKTVEGEDWEETQVASAKVLGTLFLQSPRTGRKLSELHQKLKPAYKATLALRLLDKLLQDGNITHKFISKKYQSDKRYSRREDDLTVFQQDVCLPVIMAAFFQDIGLQHPDAQKLLKGEDGKLDEFRLLDKDTRINLLKLNHKHTIDYLINGLGVDDYVGNSKEHRDNFNDNEQTKLKFVHTLIVDALKPKLAVGNIIKIPQIYSSIVFSTKANANYNDLPKATLVIEKAAENGSVNSNIAKLFVDIVGHFPQGYGITYIPKDSDGNWYDRYEYAIAVFLNPKHPKNPICRGVTRNLTFNSAGLIFAIEQDSNLHFAAARKKLFTIAPERLEEILEKLCSNFEERKEMDLIPQYWQPYDCFCYTKFQNLWKKA